MPKLIGRGITNGLVITAGGVIVGRERGCDVVLRSKNISPQHARLILRAAIPCVEDLNSCSGTRVNGVPVEGIKELRTGDKVTFGDLTFELVDDHVSHGDVHPDAAPSAPVKPLTESSEPAPQSAESLAAVAFRQILNSIPSIDMLSMPRPRARQKPVRKEPSASPPVPQVSATPIAYLRETCIATFIASLIIAFLLGRGARALGALELPGERSAIQNLLMPPPVEPTTPDESSINSIATTQPGTQPQEPAVNRPSQPGTQQTSDQRPAPKVASEERSEVMSIADSAKAVRLLKEVQRAGVDVNDDAAVLKIATTQLDMTPAQLQRVVKFVRVMAERKSIIEGRASPFRKTASPSPTTSTASGQSTPATSRPAATTPPTPPTPPTSAAEQSGDTLSTATDASPVQTNSRVTFIQRKPGYFLNFWGLLLVLGAFLSWQGGLSWMGRDQSQNGLEPPEWLPVACLAGPVGLMLALCCPDLGCGVMLNVACVTGPLLGYVAYREERVGNSARLLTFLNQPEPSDVTESSRTLGQPALHVEFLSHSGTNQKLQTETASLRKRPAFRDAQALLDVAVTSRASDLNLEPQEKAVQACLRVDGNLSTYREYPVFIGRQIVEVFKTLASLNVKERHETQVGSLRVQVKSEPLYVRVSSMGTILGERLALRLLRDQQELSNLAGLGCLRKLQGELRDLSEHTQGMILICGPECAGKSTTLRALLSELNVESAGVATLEEPVEYPLPAVQQFEINATAGQTFPMMLNKALETAPRTLVLSEIRDQKMAIAACREASSGRLVLSTVRSKDTLSTIQQLIDWGAGPEAVAEGLTAIVGQRLLRRLCPRCKVQYQPDAEILRRNRIPSDHAAVYYQPPKVAKGDVSCVACGGTGYRGQVGIFELLTVDDTIRKLIREGLSSAQIRTVARRRGMTTLRENGFRLAMRGITSLEEVIAVTKDDHG